MNKKLRIFLIAALALSMMLALIACDKADPNERSYAMPEGLALDIAIYDGGTKLGSISAANFADVKQEMVAYTVIKDEEPDPIVTNYIGYSVKSLLEKAGITVPAFTKLVALGSDHYASEVTVSSLDNAYISIGTEEEGAFVSDKSAPRLIADKTSNSGSSIAKNVCAIIVNPVTNDASALLSDSTSIKVLVGATEVGTINKTLLAKLTANKVKYTAVKDDKTTITYYAAYALSDILEALEYDGTVASVTTKASDDEAGGSFTDVSKMYLTVGYADGYAEKSKTTVYLADGSAPRFIGNSESSSNSDINKSVVKIIITEAA